MKNKNILYLLITGTLVILLFIQLGFVVSADYPPRAECEALCQTTCQNHSGCIGVNGTTWCFIYPEGYFPGWTFKCWDGTTWSCCYQAS